MLTTDPNDPDLRKVEPNGMQAKYLVLSKEERAKGFVMPVYRSYRHVKCGCDTHIGQELCETYARNPKFYNGTLCAHCGAHFPLTVDGAPQFYWIADDGERTVPVGAGPDDLLAWWDDKRRKDADKVAGAYI